MRPRRFQQGGVFDTSLASSPDVGGIPGSPVLQQPTISPSSLPDLLSMARTSEDRKYKEEQRILKERQLLEADQDQLVLTDDLFGEVHNDQQKSIIEKAKSKYGVKPLAEVNLDNPYELKNQIRARQIAAADPEVKQVLGQVEGVNKLKEMAARPGSLTDDEVQEWEKRYNEYIMWGKDPSQKGLFNDRLLFPSAVNKPKPVSQTKFATATQAVVANNMGLDPSNDSDRGKYFHNVAMAWHQTDAEGAEKLGYITVDPATGFPTLTPLGQQTALTQHEALNKTFQFKQDASIKTAAAKAENSAQIRKKYKVTSTGKEVDEEEYVDNWGDFVKDRELAGTDLSGLDINDPDVRIVFDQILTSGGDISDTEARREEVADRLAELKAKRETQQGKADLEAEERNRALQKGIKVQSPSTTATTVSPVTPKTTGKKYNPATGRFE